ncbi:MAG: hypothetical protein ACHQK9_08515 [Reyranellales bacterium]
MNDVPRKRPEGSIVQTLLFMMLSAALAIGFIYLLLAFVGLAWTPWSCLTTSDRTISNLAGFDFEIVRTDCSTIAKTASMSVTISRLGQSHQTTILRYDPAWNDDGPEITAIDQHTVRISIPKMRYIDFSMNRVGELNIVYDMGHILNP